MNRTRLQDRAIVLVGHRGVGKTTVGRRLAERLQRPFVDIDEIIRVQTGRTIKKKEIPCEDRCGCCLPSAKQLAW